MKNTFLAVLSALALISACGNVEWYEVKDQFAMEKPAPDPGDNGEDNGEETPGVSRWAALADSCDYVLVENFLNKEKGFFWSTPQNVANASAYIYWQQAHAMDVIVAAYNRIKDSNPSLASTYKGYMKLWYENYGHNYNTSRRGDGVHGGFFNQYTDDMCWICLTLCHISEALEDDTYIDTARRVYDAYIIPRVITDEKGSGLPWTNIEDKQGRNSCTNGPGCCLASKLYMKYGEQKYLDDAKMLYDYMMANNVKADYRCEEPPLSYTQGTFGEACRLLYHITSESSYLYLAFNVINYAFTSTRCTTNGILRSEGTSMDQSIFKAVLMPYALNLVKDGALDAESRNAIKELMLKNAEALYKSLDRSAYPQMYAAFYWGNTWSPSENAPYASMGAQVSGCSLLEAVAAL